MTALAAFVSLAAFAATGLLLIARDDSPETLARVAATLAAILGAVAITAIPYLIR